MKIFTQNELAELPQIINQNMGSALKNTLESIKKIPIENFPNLIFVAIDNDLLPKIDFIKHFLLQNKSLPIVGESALGTFIVVNHHKEKKELILKDCLPLIDLCSSFMIFIDKPMENIDDILKDFADGVFYELVYWLFKSTGSAVTIVNINNHSAPQLHLVNISIIKKLQFDSKFKQDIYSVLDQHVGNKNPSQYLCVADQHAKYMDWLRTDAFKEKKVPLNAYTLFNTGLIILAGGDENFRLLSRVALALKCNEICVYGPLEQTKVALVNLDPYILCELYLILSFSPYAKISYKSFSEVNVPKYCKSELWSFTNKELSETKQEKEGPPILQRSSLFFPFYKDAPLIKNELELTSDTKLIAKL